MLCILGRCHSRGGPQNPGDSPAGQWHQLRHLLGVCAPWQCDGHRLQKTPRSPFQYHHLHTRYTLNTRGSMKQLPCNRSYIQHMDVVEGTVRILLKGLNFLQKFNDCI